MTQDQASAQKIWLASATYENEFRPLSMEALAKLLGDEHNISTSSSALGRWRSKYGWKEILEVQISTALTKDVKVREVIEKSSMKEGSQKIFDDFQANEAIKNRSYTLVGRQLKHYENKMDEKGHLSEKEVKIVVDLLKLTSDREDNLLDRQAMLSAAKLMSSSDVKKEIAEQEIDLEEYVDIEIDE